MILIIVDIITISNMYIMTDSSFRHHSRVHVVPFLQRFRIVLNYQRKREKASFQLCVFRAHIHTEISFTSSNMRTLRQRYVVNEIYCLYVIKAVCRLPFRVNVRNPNRLLTLSRTETLTSDCWD